MPIALTNPDDLETINSFNSRRNSVATVKTSDGQLLVMKRYRRGSGGFEEASLLTELALQGVRVPQVLAVSKECLFLEYIRGVTIAELIDCGDDRNWQYQLADWLISLHHSRDDEVCRIKSDVNLRNFLLAEDGIHGLDFEQDLQGEPVEDVGRIAAFVLSHRPAFSKRRWRQAREFAHACMINEGKYNPWMVSSCLKRELADMARRRPAQRVQIQTTIESLEYAPVGWLWS